MTDPGGNTQAVASADFFQPLGFGSILERLFKLCWANAKSFILVVALLVVPPNVLLVLAFAQLPPELFQQAQSGSFARSAYVPEPEEFLVAGALALAAMILGIVGWSAATGAGFFIAESAHAGLETDWKACVRAGLRRIGSIIWITILTGLLLFLVFGAILAPGLFAVIAAQDVSSILVFLLMLLLGLGTMLTLWVFWAPAPAAVIAERVGGSKALRRSFRLVKGNFFWIAGVLFVTLAAGWVIGSIFTMPASFVSLTSGGQNPSVNLPVTMAANVLSIFVTMPLQVTMTALIYVDARVKKEGLTPAQLREELQSSLR